MKFNTTPVRGTVDYLPTEMEIRTYAERIITNTYRENGFLQIKTPILENLDLLLSGDSGDNQKLMFKTVKRGGKLDLSKPNLRESDIVEEGLRYDLTVPLVRFFAGNKEKLPYPFKSIQIDEAFRAERPQRGRVREFTQCDIDILGESSPLAEIELLCAGAMAYSRLGFENIVIKINDRRLLNEVIEKVGFDPSETIEICISLDKFDKIGEQGVYDELIQNNKDEKYVRRLLEFFEKLKTAKTNEESFEYLLKYGISENVINSLKVIIETTEKFLPKSFKLVFDSTIIRGQGYYTGTIFEVYDEDFGRAIGAGGRYDNMVEKFSGTKVPAVGFSIGFYSVVMLMIEKKILPKNVKIALIYNNDNTFEEIMIAKNILIQKGYETSVFLFPKNFKNFVSKLKNNGYNKIVKIQDLDKIIEI